MIVYYNEKQFPEAAEKCFSNPRCAMINPIQYIPSDENRVLVAANDSDQADFEAFWDMIDDSIAYIIDTVVKDMGTNYVAFLEETFGEEFTQRIFMRTFKVDGVDWLPVEA